MNKGHLFQLILISLLMFQCNSENIDSNPSNMAFKEIASPAKKGGEPNLFVSSNDQAVLSWIEYKNDTTNALVFSRLEKGQWSTPIKVAEGSNWFVNWADFPSLISFPKKPSSIAAHWLEKRNAGTYDYDIQITLSNDAGHTWPYTFVPHRDEIAAEHGFVSFIPLENGHILATWLDGRNTKIKEAKSNTHGGAMTLRTAEFDEKGLLFEEAELDNRVCDCCQTDAALTTLGPVVVYRDRSENEIRDISIVRKINGQWTAPNKIHNDNWKIAGCPVNGPAIVAKDDFVAVAWFTGSDRENKVRVVLSNDSGKTFTDAIQVDDGNPIGRVDVELVGSESVLVSWIEQIEDVGEIRIAKVNMKQGKKGKSKTVVKTGISRQSGFPKLKKIKENYLITWVAVDSIKTVKTAILTI